MITVKLVYLEKIIAYLNDLSARVRNLEQHADWQIRKHADTSYVRQMRIIQMKENETQAQLHDILTADNDEWEYRRQSVENACCDLMDSMSRVHEIETQRKQRKCTAEVD